MTPIAFEGHLTDDRAQALVDGALPTAEAAGMELHAAGCAACGALVESYRMLSAALEDLAVPMPPDDFTEGVLARIDAREQSVARERRHALAIFGGVVGLAVAAFAIAGAGAWAPVFASLGDGLGTTARAFQIGESFLPALVRALRLEIIVASALAALPILLVLSRLVPAPRAETA